MLYTVTFIQFKGVYFYYRYVTILYFEILERTMYSRSSSQADLERLLLQGFPAILAFL